MPREAPPGKSGNAEGMPRQGKVTRPGLRERAREFRRRTLPAAIPLAGQQDYVPFVVVTRSRSGSTMLIERLDSHPQIEADGELLQHADSEPVETRLARIFGPRRHGVGAYGFKIFHYHPLGDKSGRIWELLAARRDLRIIHLRRRSVLRTVVSLRIAEKAATWHRRADGSGHLPVDRRRIRLEPEEVRHAAKVAKWVNGIAAERFPDHAVLQVAYEDLVSHPAREDQRILDFLGINHQPLRTTLVRQNSEPLADLVENFDELKSIFAETELAAWFEETE